MRCAHRRAKRLGRRIKTTLMMQWVGSGSALNIFETRRQEKQCGEKLDYKSLVVRGRAPRIADLCHEDAATDENLNKPICPRMVSFQIGRYIGDVHPQKNSPDSPKQTIVHPPPQPA